MIHPYTELVTDPTDRDMVQRAFAATYDDGDGVRILGDYQTLQRYAEEHDAGAVRAARAVGIEESTAESWLEKGGRPAPLRGIQRLEERGWLDLEWGTAPLPGLTSLLTWVFVRGRIDHWDPLWRVAGDESLARLEAAADAAGINVVHKNGTGGPTILTPEADGWLLGRLLVGLGAPLGRPTQAEGLPGWLVGAPAETRERVARLYVSEAAFPAPDGEGLAIHESRPQSYADDLIALLESVTDGDVWGPGWPIRLRGAAVEDLQRDPAY